MCVLATFGADRRRQCEHAFDSERHLRRGFGYDNLAIRSREPWHSIRRASPIWFMA